ncbi:MAG: adenylate/guanylate cyclase domain-containing protein, partial [Pseudomonadota bacterium]
MSLLSRLPTSLFTHLGTAAPDKRLPSRVFEVIRRQEEASERLIGWVQLALVVLFGTLYSIAPRPADAMELEPVPIFLAAYFLFTVARLALTYRGYMPGWLLVASMLADVGMLMGLIWSFHIQYQEPASFYLKVPTFTYIFIFISLRAMRFDHRFILSIGLFAALGWLIMVMYAVETSGPDAVTRNFVTYLTSNAILLGAEFDKIATILVVTAILTFAIWQARRTLVTAVREQAASEDIKRFLSAGVAEAVTSSEDVIEEGRAEERDAAIVMIDIRGFTRFSTGREPREVVGVLVEFHQRIVPIIAAHNGVIDKFLGDGAMITFGAVEPSETAAADALRALDEIMTAAVEWQAGLTKSEPTALLTVNGAMAAGEVVFATLGGAGRLEYTVIGQAANLAAKLEKHNKAEGVAALTTRAGY